MKIPSSIESASRIIPMPLFASSLRIRYISDATKSGISMVYQEQSLLPNISVAENIFLGIEGDAVKFGTFSLRRIRANAIKYLDQVSIKVNEKSITTLEIAKKSKPSPESTAPIPILETKRVPARPEVAPEKINAIVRYFFTFTPERIATSSEPPIT